MLAATVVTTFWSGWNLVSPDLPPGRAAADAMTFPAALLSILLAHELGHFLACRVHGLDATLPLFFPAPPFPFAIGTFGAFIRIRSRIRERAKLFDVGAAGPLAGFVLAVAWTIVGMHWSKIIPIPTGGESLQFGESLLFKAIRVALVGSPAAGSDVELHPIALAGWFGMFVTSLNLIMAGQLDGGHILHAMFGRAHRLISRVAFVGLVWWAVLGDPVLGAWWNYVLAGALLVWPIVLSLRPAGRKIERNVFIVLVLLQIVAQVVGEVSSASSVWLVWGLLVYLFGLDHPPAADLQTPLGRGRLALGVLCLLVFVGTFIPLPIKALAN
jgi:membrane-associated protease RseP (regulator of RpoE activity)